MSTCAGTLAMVWRVKAQMEDILHKIIPF